MGRAMTVATVIVVVIMTVFTAVLTGVFITPTHFWGGFIGVVVLVVVAAWTAAGERK